jgi:hypothetical protein
MSKPSPGFLIWFSIALIAAHSGLIYAGSIPIKENDNKYKDRAAGAIAISVIFILATIVGIFFQLRNIREDSGKLMIIMMGDIVFGVVNCFLLFF